MSLNSLSNLAKLCEMTCLFSLDFNIINLFSLKNIFEKKSNPLKKPIAMNLTLLCLYFFMKPATFNLKFDFKLTKIIFIPTTIIKTDSGYFKTTNLSYFTSHLLQKIKYYSFSLTLHSFFLPYHKSYNFLFLFYTLFFKL